MLYNAIAFHTATDQYYPSISITSEIYHADNVTLTVEWPQQVGTVYVRILPEPLVPLVNFTSSTSHRLTVSYNTEYKLSVEAAVTAPCRSNVTASIRLNYGKILIVKHTTHDNYV